ncbi:MAG: alpha/beta hydrolase family protein, partial [Anaerolineales bacterium]
ALSGDGYYFYTPMRHRRKSLWTMRRLFAMLRKLTGARAERISISHLHGKTVGLLHLPPGAEDLSPRSLPALVALHPLGGDKDSFDYFLGQFRAMRYATFCVDLPAHGENYDGPRLKPDAECVGAAALEKLAAHPAIDPNRLGVIGGSMGGFFALRTAAASPLAKACLAFAAPFDMGARAHQMVPGIVDSFAWVVGAATLAEAHAHVQRFHLRDALGNIRCPVGIVHGTQDHICDFTATYAIASRITAPVSVFPLVGADHERKL